MDFHFQPFIFCGAKAKSFVEKKYIVVTQYFTVFRILGYTSLQVLDYMHCLINLRKRVGLWLYFFEDK